MARSNRKLSNFGIFDSNDKNEQFNDSVKQNSNNEEIKDSELLNSNNEQIKDSELLNSNSEHNNDSVFLTRDFLSEYKEIERNRRPRVEETHTRDTYLIRNDLLARFNKLAENQKKGFKMKLINYVLEKELNMIEKNQMGGE
jgi:hypothetical protein